MVAECDDAIYVAFMGTKQVRDLFANANASLVPIWPGSHDPDEVHRQSVSNLSCVPLKWCAYVAFLSFDSLLSSCLICHFDGVHVLPIRVSAPLRPQDILLAPSNHLSSSPRLLALRNKVLSFKI